MELSEVQRRFADYGFYHTIELAPGVRTPGWPVVVPLVELTLRSLHSLDLRGKRVLDVGCRDGLFAFEAERLGAREVVAIDNDLSRGAVEVLIPFLRSRVRMHEMNLLDLRPETFGTFDVVIMPGVLYHLRYPFWALKLIRDLLSEGGCLVLETALFIDDNRHAVLRCPVETDSPYEATSCTFFNRKGLIDTLGSLGLLPLTFEYLSNAPLVAGRPVSLEPARTDAPQGPDGTMSLDRATLVCRHTNRAADSQAANYWEGTHTFSSSRKGSWWQALATARPAPANTAVPTPAR